MQAPAPIRGLCTCIFTGFVYLGIVLAYFANYGAAIHLAHTHARWVCDSFRSRKDDRLTSIRKPQPACISSSLAL